MSGSCRLPLLLLFLSCTCFCSTYGAPSSDPSRYKTGYACEGRELDISCTEGTTIQLMRANFGRYSISICNEHGTLDWKVDCTSSKSHSVLSNRCNAKQKCTVSAHTDLFGPDPCPGTRKYLEVQYQCISPNGTGSSSSDPFGSKPHHFVLGMKNPKGNGFRPISSSPSSPTSTSTSTISRPFLPAKPTIIIPSTPLRKSTSTSTMVPPTSTASSIGSFDLSASISSKESFPGGPLPPLFDHNSDNPFPTPSSSVSPSTSSSPRMRIENKQESNTDQFVRVTTPFWLGSMSSTHKNPDPSGSNPSGVDTPLSEGPYLFPTKNGKNEPDSVSINSVTSSNGNHISVVEEEPVSKMLLLVISCLVSVIFSFLALPLLSTSRTRCDRSSIYKNLCITLIVLELVLVLIVYRPLGTSDESPALTFSVSLLLHFFLLSLFCWILCDSFRVFVSSTRSLMMFPSSVPAPGSGAIPTTSSPCDVALTRALYSALNLLFTSSKLVYIFSYGIPAICVTAFALIHPEVYSSTSMSFMWIRGDNLIVLFSPVVTSIILSLLLFVLTIISRDSHPMTTPGTIHNLRPGSGISNASTATSNGGSNSSTYKEQRDHLTNGPASFMGTFSPPINPVTLMPLSSLLPPIVLLSVETPMVILAHVYFSSSSSLHSPSLFLTSAFGVINVLQSVVLFVLCLVGNDKSPSPHLPPQVNSGSKVSSLLPSCLANLFSSSPNKTVNSNTLSHGSTLHHPLHHTIRHPHHTSMYPSASPYHASSPGSTPNSNGVSTSFLYSLDPTQLMGAPPSPLIRSSVLSQSHHHLHVGKESTCATGLLAGTGSSSSNSSGNSTATTNTHVTSNMILNLRSSTMNNNLSRPVVQPITASSANGSNTMHQLHHRNSNYIQDVSPYAAPVSVTGHEYEDIGNPTGRDSYSMTLSFNTQSNQQQQQPQGSQSHTMGPGRYHQNSYRQDHDGVDHDSLYYETIPNQVNTVSQGNQGASASSGGSSLPPTTGGPNNPTIIYGANRNNGLTNYVFHNTRSPIYYSESRR